MRRRIKIMMIMAWICGERNGRKEDAKKNKNNDDNGVDIQ